MYVNTMSLVSPVQYEYEVKVKDFIETPCKTTTFFVTQILWEGSYAKVVKCSNFQAGKFMAMKLSRIASYAEHEASVLKDLGEDTANENNIVQFYECFRYVNKTCLTFELLEQSLDKVLCMRWEKHSYYPLRYIRPIATQLLTALVKLKSLGIVHQYVTPDHIMLVDSANCPNKVKLIGFGSAYPAVGMERSLPFQSLGYRAPEVHLKLYRDEAVDIWSLGCVLVEMFIGRCLFAGACLYDVMQGIIHTLGLPPASVLDIAPQSDDFFFIQDVRESQPPVWRLKSLEELPQEIASKSKEQKHPLKNLEFLAQCRELPDILEHTYYQMEVFDRRAFIDLLQNMLAIDANCRITPSDALTHTFITM